jgi:hypothetical protein
MANPRNDLTPFAETEFWHSLIDSIFLGWASPLPGTTHVQKNPFLNLQIRFLLDWHITFFFELL